MAYQHGIYTDEAATRIAAPVLSTAGLIVAVGTAPVNQLADPSKAVNVPILANSYEEAVAAVGYSSDYANYTLCDAIDAAFKVGGCGPIVLINVLDPATHQQNMTGGTISVSDGVAKINEVGVIVSTLDVKINNTSQVYGTDYTVTFNEDGTANIVPISTAAKAAASFVVSGKKLDPAAVTDAQIVGSVDSNTGAITGMQLMRQIYPRFNLVPGILIAPRKSKSATVAAAMQAICKDLSGVFNFTCIVDIDSSASGATKYTDVNTKKTAQGVTSEIAYAVWLYGKVGEAIYCGSSLAAAATVRNDSENADTPNVSASNKAVAITAACLEDGTEVFLDQEQANVVNSYGVATFLNWGGFKLWGNRTAAFPGNTDPKDCFYAVKRFFLWTRNNFILSYARYVDNPGNKVLIQAIVDSENIRGNGFVSRGVCARYEIVYDENENDAVSLMEGRLAFHQYLAPYVPAEVITDTFEFDPDAILEALSA